MSIKAYCAGCGEDCSHCYGTWMGEPYHIMCIPAKPRKRVVISETENRRIDSGQDG